MLFYSDISFQIGIKIEGNKTSNIILRNYNDNKKEILIVDTQANKQKTEQLKNLVLNQINIINDVVYLTNKNKIKNYKKEKLAYESDLNNINNLTDTDGTYYRLQNSINFNNSKIESFLKNKDKYLVFDSKVNKDIIEKIDNNTDYKCHLIHNDEYIKLYNLINHKVTDIISNNIDNKKILKHIYDKEDISLTNKLTFEILNPYYGLNFDLILGFFLDSEGAVILKDNFYIDAKYQSIYILCEIPLYYKHFSNNINSQTLINFINKPLLLKCGYTTDTIGFSFSLDIVNLYSDLYNFLVINKKTLKKDQLDFFLILFLNILRVISISLNFKRISMLYFSYDIKEKIIKIYICIFPIRLFRRDPNPGKEQPMIQEEQKGLQEVFL